MTSTLFAATVGLAVSMSVAGSKTVEQTVDAPAAAGFVKFKKAVECWVAVTPTAPLGFINPQDTATLKNTVGPDGKPCLHASYGVVADVAAYVGATTVYTLVFPTTTKGVAAPTWEIQHYFGRNARGGVVTAAGQVRNLRGDVFPNDLNLPPGSIVYMTAR